MMMISSFGYKFEDISGKQYGRVFVEKFSHEPVEYRRFWLCKCACGKPRTIREDYIKKGFATCSLCRRIEIRTRTGTRTCPSCEKELDRASYNNDKHTTDGLARYCKTCVRSMAHKRRARLARRRPEEIIIPKTKLCQECRLVKQSEDFWSDKSQPDGLTNACCDCKNAKHRDWYWRVGRARKLPTARVDRYGISIQDLHGMIEIQSNKCAICSKEFTNHRSYAIDHDHVTGKVRGLLCNGCNTGIGILGDSVDRLKLAIRYLEHHAFLRL